MKKASAKSKSCNTFPENIRRSEQADHNIAGLLEIVKVTWLHQNIVIAQQSNCGIFIVNDDGIPAAFDIENTQSRLAQKRQIRPCTLGDLSLHRLA